MNLKSLVSSALIALAAFSLPLSVGAQSGPIRSTDLGTLLDDIVFFINDYLIPFIFAIAFIVFIWGVFQYFIAGGANEEQRDKGKQLVMWGIIGFVVMISVWGLINLVRNTFSLDESGNMPSLPEFNQNR